MFTKIPKYDLKKSQKYLTKILYIDCMEEAYGCWHECNDVSKGNSQGGNLQSEEENNTKYFMRCWGKYLSAINLRLPT